MCAQSNDVENPITACKLSKTKDGETVYYKASESFACVCLEMNVLIIQHIPLHIHGRACPFAYHPHSMF